MDKGKLAFRKKAIDSISKPEQLNDYLRVSQPLVWLLLAGILIILIGLLCWNLVGTVDIAARGNAFVSDGQATIMLENNEKYQLNEGMKVIIDDKDTTITKVELNEFGTSVGYADISGADGTYPASIIVRSSHPLELLFGV